MVKVKTDMTGWKMWEHGFPNSRLIVLERAEDHVGPSGQRSARWICQCSCNDENGMEFKHHKMINIQNCTNVEYILS